MILDLSLEAKQSHGAWVTHIWWERGGIKLEGVRVNVRVAEVEFQRGGA